MNNEDLQVQFKVIGIFGAPRNTTTLGTYDCIRAAQERVDTWQNDSQFVYTHFDELKIVKHSQVTVQTTCEHHHPEPSRVDYERQGVPPSTGRFEGIRGGNSELEELLRNLEDRFVGFRDEVMLNLGDAMLDIKHMQGDKTELRKLVEHLEDRHVGLRHELLTDMENLQEDVEDLRDAVSATADIDVLEDAMKHEVAGLRREMESLRAELRQGKTEKQESRR